MTNPVRRAIHAAGRSLRPIVSVPADRRIARSALRHHPEQLIVDTDHWSSHVAIVATYPRAPLTDSILRLITGLRALGATVVLVANDSPDRSSCTEQWIDHCDALIHRANLGRDFGAYRTGYTHVLTSAPLERIERVSFFNDSVLHLPTTPALLSQWFSTLEHDGSRGCHALAVKEDGRPRPQTFAFTLDARTAFDPAVRHYWQRLLPSDDRATIVRRGERRFAEVLSGIDAPVVGLLRFELLDDLLDGDWGRLRSAERDGLRWALQFRPAIGRESGCTADEISTATADTTRAVAGNVLRWLGPNRAFGLLAARTAGFPLKLDIIGIGAATPAGVSEALVESGMDEEERVGVERLMASHRIEGVRM